MATYKVPQDVEAEDKLLGPLTFKQFVFLLIAAGAGLMAWFLFRVQPYLVIIPIPVIVAFGGLALFRREDQPAEQYLLSLFNFLLRPRKRVWNPEGYYEHFILSAPKKVAAPDLKQDIRQAHGQLEKLAQTVDTRGWASKRPELTVPGQKTRFDAGDDRLFVPDTKHEEASDMIEANDDIMDDDNPDVRQLDDMLERHSQKNKEKLLEDFRQQIAENATETAGTPKKPFPKADTEAAKDEPPVQEVSSVPSDILEVADQVSVSQLAAKVNRKDQNIEEGEEIRLR